MTMMTYEKNSHESQKGHCEMQADPMWGDGKMMYLTTSPAKTDFTLQACLESQLPLAHGHLASGKQA